MTSFIPINRKERRKRGIRTRPGTRGQAEAYTKKIITEAVDSKRLRKAIDEEYNKIRSNLEAGKKVEKKQLSKLKTMIKRARKVLGYDYSNYSEKIKRY